MFKVTITNQENGEVMIDREVYCFNFFGRIDEVKPGDVRAQEGYDGIMQQISAGDFNLSYLRLMDMKHSEFMQSSINTLIMKTMKEMIEGAGMKEEVKKE